jgi:hypothetical protein
MGSHGPRGMQRVIRYGWLPNAGPGVDLPKQITELRRPAEQGWPRSRNNLDHSIHRAARSKILDQQRAARAEPAVYFLPAAGADKVLPLLDQYAKVIWLALRLRYRR